MLYILGFAGFDSASKKNICPPIGIAFVFYAGVLAIEIVSFFSFSFLFFLFAKYLWTIYTKHSHS